MATIKVKAGDGRLVCFPLRVTAAPGRKTLRLSGAEVADVDDAHRFVRRSLRNGDLVVVKPPQKKRTAKGPGAASGKSAPPTHKE